MAALKLALLTAVLLGLVVIMACNESDQDEKRASHSNGTAQTATPQKPGEKPDSDEGEEGEEGPAIPAAVAAEKPAPLQAHGQQLVYNFDSDSNGQLPGNSMLPLLIADEGSFQDLDLSVKFKAVSGSIDRAGGLVFRLKDPNNYYIVRSNALENNYRLYHVVNGRRSQFAGANLKVTSGEWHELRVEAAGNKITCYYDGNKKIEATDDTFKDAGKVGLWTKADSVTYFDDLKVTAK